MVSQLRIKNKSLYIKIYLIRCTTRERNDQGMCFRIICMANKSLTFQILQRGRRRFLRDFLVFYKRKKFTHKEKIFLK